MEGKYSMREDQIVEAARREEAAQAVKKPTTILDFPREVRLRIYGHVFDSLNSNPTISRLATFPVLPFMRANRTLRAEAWEPWFAHLDSAIAADERLLRWIMWERQRMDHLSRTHPVTEIDTDRRRLCIGRNRCVATLVIDRIGKSKTLRAMREFMESGIELAVGTPERFWREGVPPPRPVTVTEEKREFVEYGLERAIGTQEQFWTEESSPPSPAEVIEDDDEMYYIGGAMGMGWA